MNISLRIVKKNPNEEGNFPLFIRVRGKGKSGKDTETNISTGFFIKDTHLKNGVLSTRTPNYTVKNNYISTVRSDLDYIITELKREGLVPNPKLIKKRFLQREKLKIQATPEIISFWNAFEEYQDTKKFKSKGYLKTITRLKNRLRDFEESKSVRLTFEYVVGNHKRFQFDFQDYLWTKEVKCSNSYVNKLLKQISQFLNYCFENNYIQKKPKFTRNEVFVSDDKVHLTQKEIFSLFNFKKWDYEEGKDFSNNPHIYIVEDVLEGTKKEKYGLIRKLTNWELVKDIFLFQCSVGCRYGDIQHFRINHFEFDSQLRKFKWIQQKTKKYSYVPENHINGEIFRKYSSGKKLNQRLFPSLSIQKFNKTLKFIGKDIGLNRIISRPRKVGSELVDTKEKMLWEVLTSHAGRRTFIKNLIDMGTMDYKSIMKLSGHSTFSEFERYIPITNDDLKKGMKLFQMDDPKTDNEVDELVKTYSQLDEEKRKLVLNLVRSL